MLAVLLKRIAAQEARRVTFYATQARDRLATSKKAQVLARFAPRTAWGPVGSTIMPPVEVHGYLGNIPPEEYEQNYYARPIRSSPGDAANKTAA